MNNAMQDVPENPWSSRLVLLVGAAFLIVIVFAFVSPPRPPRTMSAAFSAPAGEIPAVIETATDPAETPATGEQPARIVVEAASPLESLGGLQVTSVTLAPSGAAVDIRYRITSKEKASSLGDRGSSAFLVDSETGKSIPMLTQLAGPRVSAKTRAMSAKMSGHLNGFPPATALERVEGQLCSILVPNMEGLLHKGSRVSLRVGHLVADNLTVQRSLTLPRP